ncbi:hypothetical protein [Croceitalea rosinachiae]|uniref:Uncharacterized protein n=1 Tax=Croceitalea rosinachiae TaxID=3075596 RepID=A0ABU3AFQ5_9FLAO|nr:hypothetical protein [Croceitalea sp. F388]MDT0607711.1 hypothetical protein [Croceitalea sp. F388]
MKKFLFVLGIAAMAALGISAAIEKDTVALTADFTYGNPEISSINSMSFGPEGILFIGDSKKATIYALDTQDKAIKEKGGEIRIEGFDKKIAASLGTTVDDIKIMDMVVNPISKMPYFSISTIDGTPVVLRLNGENLENISLKAISYSEIKINDPIGEDVKDKWERPQRIWSISDLKYHNGKVMVSGLSNKEFASTFRSIPFPFSESQMAASLEIWHAAHGAFETHAPIKTFDVITLEGTDYLMASYTCTPLVLFPMGELTEGVHQKGRTVAELGAGNSPLDMISYEKEGEKYFLMSNNNRPVMRFDYSDIANFKETLTEPVEEFAVATGVPYDNLPFPHVLQMDLLDNENVLYVQRTADGDVLLRSRSTKWM